MGLAGRPVVARTPLRWAIIETETSCNRGADIRLLAAADIERLLPMASAIDIAAAALRAISSGEGEYPARMHVALANGDALVMPGYDGLGHLGVKVATIHPENAAHGKPGTRASYLLVDSTDGELELICDGTALTALRTGAVSGLATRLLARPDASVLAIFGAGRQARTQVQAVCAVRPISQIHVVSRNAARADAFVASLRDEFPHVAVDRAPEQAVAHAHVIVTATNSTTPVFAAESVAPGSHINAIGSFRPDMCELDPVLLGRATVFVDQRGAALCEAGEIRTAVEKGLLEGDALIELGRAGERARQTQEEITVFKTVGHAALDLFAAVELLRRAELDGHCAESAITRAVASSAKL